VSAPVRQRLHVIVEHAGTALPCGGDCLPILFAAVAIRTSRQIR